MKTEKNNDIDLLITQYLSGKLDKEAFAQLKDWASESEENRIYVRWIQVINATPMFSFNF